MNNKPKKTVFFSDSDDEQSGYGFKLQKNHFGSGKYLNKD